MSATTPEILSELKRLGKESYKRVLMNNHGVQEPCFGVPISELKRIQKRLKQDHRLALELYDSGNYDAMYLAGLLADEARMTRRDLQHWAEKARAASLPGATVPGVAAGSPYGWELALKWIESTKPFVAVAGWATLAAIVSVKADAELDLPKLKQLLQRVQRTIQDTPDVVRYHMNAFVIAAGCYVPALTEYALQLGEEMGPVLADLGNNDCQVPFAPDYIRKVQQRGTIGRKRKTAKC